MSALHEMARLGGLNITLGATGTDDAALALDHAFDHAFQPLEPSGHAFGRLGPLGLGRVQTSIGATFLQTL